MDFKELLQTLLSLVILLFVLAALRKAIIWVASGWNLTGVASFLA